MAEGNAPRSMRPARMVGFSDGVFSIAATVLVLDIALASGDTALKQVLNTWPAYLGYLISFLTIGGSGIARLRTDWTVGTRCSCGSICCCSS